MELDLIIRAARCADTCSLEDLGIAGGRIVARTPRLEARAVEEIDAQGHVVLPGLVEAHLHLDKAFLNDRAANHSGTLAEAIAVTRELKPTLSPCDIAKRAEAAVRQILGYGTTAVRAETEFDPVIGLAGIDAVLTLKRRYAGLIDIQVVAFPQEGIHQTPGTEQLFQMALERGADVVGGVPYNDLSAERHIDLCFDLARTFNRPLSFHQDFRDQADALSIEYLARKTIQMGWEGRVEVGHMTALGALPREQLAAIAHLLRDASISVVALPLTDLHLGGRLDPYNVRRGLAPIAALLDYGVNVAISTNNLRNAFTPFGNGDILQALFVTIPAAHLGGADHLERALDLVTINAARAIGMDAGYGLAVGDRADLVVVESTRRSHVVSDVPERLWVVKGGRVTATNVVQRVVAPAPFN